MKLLAQILLLSLSLLSANAQAQINEDYSTFYRRINHQRENVFEKVEASSIKILGHGIHDRKTGAGLTLACVGPSQNQEPQCDELRWMPEV